MSEIPPAGPPPRVLIVGGGFAGLNAAKGLADAPVSVFLVDRHNYHLFQPLLYQVATAVLSPAEIATPIRHVLRDQQNVRIGLAELNGIDLARKTVSLPRGEIGYDYLILATGATHSYFGQDQWEKLAPGLKTIDDALEIRRRVLLAYEEAEWEEDVESRQAKLTFVVIGGGPTGVEMAGALKEIAARSVPRDFRFIDTTTARVILIEAGRRLLGGMPEALGRQALRDLQDMGVQVRLGCRVTGIRPGEVLVAEERLPAENVIWAAGVRGSPVARTLGVPLDDKGRVLVEADLSVPGHPEVFVIGDLASLIDPPSGQPIPGVAPAAIQMGQYVARIIAGEATAGKGPRPPFRYRDKGAMATIGRNRAVASVGGRNFSGAFAWLLWCAVHIWSLIGFRRRVFVMFSWLWSYLSFTKTARLITGNPQPRVKRPRGVIPTSRDNDAEQDDSPP
ncbi:NADH dehydrogenase [Desulfuromonas versatilis]|uniref:NADH:ubiquinone reductase (non-electrogenic) n=1 Tax=Desulfuromonas versatilis TaxID=2802975 RepID=A0ABN6E3J1_9BACT|nr:NAD(P)/FAD-dependent oxidoreductase [Desulfuromonas versatilis]BCR06903.1 NADH dehydrogenase [Desulfuromonas versatilis]